MIARARRAFPGMVVSMMLAGPALAGQAGAATDASPTPERNPARTEIRKPVPVRAVRRVAHPVAAKPRPSARHTADAAAESPDTGLQFAESHSFFHQSLVEYATVIPGQGAGGRIWSDTPGQLVTDPDESGPEQTGPEQTGPKQTGIASWYGGPRWQGKRMSNGDRYDQNALTAAHATLPIGARVRVALPDSGKFVIVTITDRPGTRTRIIDLSRAAAAELGILSRGVAMVTLSPI